MPRYDYKCAVCAAEFELVQKFSEAGQGDCPSCGGPGQRVFHAVPVIYKGSGFYTTDYGRPKRPAENSDTREASSDSTAPSPSDGGNSSADSPKPGDGGSTAGESSLSPAPAAAGSGSA